MEKFNVNNISNQNRQFELFGSNVNTSINFQHSNNLKITGKMLTEWRDKIHKHQFKISHQICEGGTTRFQSVKNGLVHCKEKGIIAVHDGVRPLIHPDLIQKLYNDAESNSAVIPVCPVLESIRKSDKRGSKALDRCKYYTVQTPQCFSSELLQNAYLQNEKVTFTDDASVVEAMGKEVHHFKGDRTNIKLTTPEDFIFAEALLNRPKAIRPTRSL